MHYTVFHAKNSDIMHFKLFISWCTVLASIKLNQVDGKSCVIKNLTLKLAKRKKRKKLSTRCTEIFEKVIKQKVCNVSLIKSYLDLVVRDHSKVKMKAWVTLHTNVTFNLIDNPKSSLNNEHCWYVYTIIYIR